MQVKLFLLFCQYYRRFLLMNLLIARSITLLLFLGIVAAKAQYVSGKIRDESGKGIPFVSVYIKGSTQGTTANE